jgi:hypothetical protein
MFFTLLNNSAKQLKLWDPSEDPTSMPKLASEEKICSMHKILSLSLYLGYKPIYRQRGGVKPELGFLLLFDLELLSEF